MSRAEAGEEWTLLVQCAESLVKQAAAAGICCISNVRRVCVPPFSRAALEAHGRLGFPLAPQAWFWANGGDTVLSVVLRAAVQLRRSGLISSLAECYIVLLAAFFCLNNAAK